MINIPKKIFVNNSGEKFFTIITFVVILYNIFLLANATESIQAAKNGLTLWFNQVLPTLFPFAVGANLLLGLGFAKVLGKFLAPITLTVFKISGAGGFAFLTGLISGYPMGAKITAGLRASGAIGREEAQRLLGFSNNAGPLFIMGFAAGLFNSVEAGRIILVSHILSAVLVGIILGRFGKSTRKTQPVTKCNRLDFHTGSSDNFGTLFAESVKNAMESMVLVGGYIILFSVLVSALEFLPGVAFLEIATGAKIAAEQNSVPLAAAVISFGGFSVHAQAAHFLKGTDLKFMPYLLAKALQAVLALTICFLLIFWRT